MADDADDAQQSESAPDPLKKLRGLREAAGREIDGLARELHVDRSVLQSLEEGDYERLGAPVFVKGHLRRYAAAVGADGDQLVAEFDACHADDAPPPVVPDKPQLRKSLLAPMWVWSVLVLAIVIIIVLVIFFLTGSSEPATSRAVPTTTPVRAEAPAETTSTESDTAAATTATRPAANTALSIPDPAPALGTAGAAESASNAADVSVASAATDTARPERPAPGTATSTAGVLELRYSAECWTEIRDARGRILYSGTAAAGQERRLRGTPPFQVVLGNRRAVTLILDGAEVPIPASAIRGRTARFAIPPRS